MLVRVTVIVLDDADRPTWSYDRAEAVRQTDDHEKTVMGSLEMVKGFTDEAVERIAHQAEGDLEAIRRRQ